MTPTLAKTLALTHADGTISIMQMFCDRDPAAEIAKGLFSSPPVSYAEITPEQAVAIRASRPRPAVQAPANAATDAITPADVTNALAGLAQIVGDLERRATDSEAKLTAILEAAKQEAGAP